MQRDWPNWYPKTAKSRRPGPPHVGRERGECVRRNQERAADVFLNTPYDRKFERLFLAYISGLSAFGLVPRASIEIPGSTRRLDRIFRLIRACKYSIHDLSRVELDGRAPRTPRFNMPFELGLCVAWQMMPMGKQHTWFVCESQHWRVAQSLSDLNGTDAYIHDGTIAGVFRELGNAFVRPGRQPSVQQMWKVYRDVRKSLGKISKSAGADSPYSATVFKEICVLASASADKNVPSLA